MTTSGAAHLPERPTPQPGEGLSPGVSDGTDALLASKLFLPAPRPDLVRRPRLTERLSAGARGPLTIIVAPAGFGKTTLLGDWLAGMREGPAHERRPVAWLALDDGDNDLARFLRYAVSALRSLCPSIGHTALASLRSPRPPPVERLLTPLLNEIAGLPEDVILVLDDYHLIDAPAIHQAISFLLDHAPPRLHLVIATRSDPPLPLARLRARGQLGELRAPDLRFTADEAASFLQRTMGLGLSADDAATLEARTEGWVAGLQLAALALHGREPAHLSGAVAALSGTHRYILDYLADEVFARQPAEVRRFLLHTSVLDRLSGALCDAVAGAGGDGQATLERLEAANLFLAPLDDSRTWYRYHHLFADFLRERLRRELPGLVPELHRRASRWYEQQGLLPEAVDHALAARDYILAARLIEQVSPKLLWQRGELTTLLRWKEHMPREVARTRPRLCLDFAWALHLSAQVDAVESWLQDAEHGLDAAPRAERGTHDHTRALRGEIAVIRAELARLRGESAAPIALARQALADLPADDRRLRSITTVFLGNAYLASGDVAAACRAYAEAVPLVQAADTITMALIASGRLILAQALHGQLHQAAATYRRTLDLATRYGLAATPAIGGAQVGMGEALREWDDLDAAEDLLRQGIARCGDANGLAQMALEGALALARALQARGDPAGSLATLDEAEALGRDRRLAQSAERIAVARARLWLTATPGDVAAAARWAVARAAAWRTGEPSDFVGLLERLLLARLRLVQGRHAEAAALLRTLLGRAEAGGVMGCVLEILALQARLLMEQGQMAQAMIALSRALELAEPEGYVRVFVDEGAPMVALLREAQARGLAPEYVTVLLAACGSEPRAPSSAAAALVEPLSARELELLKLLAAGLSTSEIAAQLFITVGTARIHLKHIYGKLDVHSRLQAVERARALGLV